MNIFTDSDIEELKKLCSKNDLLKKLFEEYMSYQTDPAKIYYIALTDAIIDISRQIKDKTIDIDNPYTKSILRLSETGDKVFNTIDRGRQEIIGALEENADTTKKRKLSKGTDIAI